MTKRDLQQVRWLEKELASKVEYLERLRAIAEKCTAHYGEGGGGGGETQDRRADIVAKIVDMERENQGIMLQVMDLHRAAIDEINALPDARCRIILEQHYLNARTLEQIANMMGYERRQVERLHGEALQQIDK